MCGESAPDPSCDGICSSLADLGVGRRWRMSDRDNKVEITTTESSYVQLLG